MSHARASDAAGAPPVPLEVVPGTRGPDRPILPPASSSAKPIMLAPTRSIGRFHPIPVIGHPEAFYIKHAQEAEAAGDRHAKASHKVGQYVTTALTPGLPWDEKLRRFTHALDKYCVPPASSDESLRDFYKKLCEIVRRHAGHAAVQVARKRHEDWCARLKAGEPRETLEDEAEVFFFNMLGHAHCPDWCCNDAYHQIVTWRDFWV